MHVNETVYPKPAPWLAAGAALLCIGLLIGFWYEPYPQLEAALFNENGVVETPELIALGIAAALFAYRAVRSDDPVGAICVAVAFVLANAAVRETSRCDSAFYDGGLCFPTQTWKNVTVALLVAIAAGALWQRRGRLRAALSIRQLGVFWPMWVAFFLLVIAETAERYGLQGAEETLELFAYLYAIAFGLWVHRNC
jgi:hypothetical protein